jgi:hypothetical protein
MHDPFYETVQGVRATITFKRKCTLIGAPHYKKNWRVKAGTVMRGDTTGYSWPDSIGYHLYDDVTGRGGYYKVPRDCVTIRHFPPYRKFKKDTLKYQRKLNRFLKGKGPLP